jgi:hypothetical protein
MQRTFLGGQLHLLGSLRLERRRRRLGQLLGVHDGDRSLPDQRALGLLARPLASVLRGVLRKRVPGHNATRQRLQRRPGNGTTRCTGYVRKGNIGYTNGYILHSCSYLHKARHWIH